MRESNGRLESLENGVLLGWVYTAEVAHYSIKISGVTVDIRDLKLRKDVLKAGYGDGICGFELDLRALLKANDISGLTEISLYADETLLNNTHFSIPSSKDINLNCYFDLENNHQLIAHKIRAPNRFSWHLDTYPFPNDYSGATKYTRLWIDSKQESDMLLTLTIKLDKKLIKQSSEVSEFLELNLLARASNYSEAVVKVENARKEVIIQEPINFLPRWELTKILFDHATFNAAVLNKYELKIVIPNDSTKFYDFAMIKIAEKPYVFDAESEINSELQQPIAKNLILNGDLVDWSNGFNFTRLRRGGEIADFWYFEASKQNIGNIRFFAQPVKAIDTGLESQKPNVGLRAITSDLEGYARIVIGLSATKIKSSNYQLRINVCALGSNKKLLIPRISILGRDHTKDHYICDIARKVYVESEQELVFSLDKVKAEKIISGTVSYPVIVLTIDLGSNIDLLFSSVSLMAVKDTTNNVTDSEEPSKDTTVTSKIVFEDESINRQLSILKGLQPWTEIVDVKDIVANEGNKSGGLTKQASNFFHNINSYKVTRPHRNYPSVDIVIPIYNAHEDVALCLRSLIEKTDVPYQLFLVNDESDTETSEMLCAFAQQFPHVTVLHNEKNIGYTKSVNKGVSKCNADWVVILNSDTIVSQRWLSKLMNCALSSGDKVGMVGPMSNAASWQSVPEIFDSNGGWNLNPLPIGMTIDLMADLVEDSSISEYPEVKVINGFCQLINMDMLTDIGCLDEVAFPQGYGEENDMCARAVKGGYKLVIADDTYVFHAKSKSFGHETRKTLSKQGSAALKGKHPDVDWKILTEEIRDHFALVQLRSNLIEKLNSASF